MKIGTMLFLTSHTSPERSHPSRVLSLCFVSDVQAQGPGKGLMIVLCFLLYSVELFKEIESNPCRFSGKYHFDVEV